MRSRNVFSLGLKELRGFFSDAVLVFMVAYSFVIGVWSVGLGSGLGVRDAQVAVVDEDRSALTRGITAALLPPQFRPPLEIGAAEAGPGLDTGRFTFVLHFPPRFEANLLAGRPTGVGLEVDATAMALAGNGSVYIRQAIAEEVAVRAGAVTQPLEVVTRARFNPNLLAGRFSAVIELVSQITVLSVVLAGSALLREREHGTLEHLLAMPVTPAEILLAKLWANGLVIVAAATLSLLLIVRGALGVPLHGSLVLFLAGIALYQLSVAALGLLLATATSSTAQFGLLAMPVLVVMNLLSGGSTPIESMPGWLQYAVQISPATQFVAFSQTVLMRGAGLDVVAPRLFALVLLGVLFLAIALVGLRRSLARSG